jgi:hypothetical protein
MRQSAYATSEEMIMRDDCAPDQYRGHDTPYDQCTTAACVGAHTCVRSCRYDGDCANGATCTYHWCER